MGRCGGRGRWWKAALVGEGGRRRCVVAVAAGKGDKRSRRPQKVAGAEEEAMAGREIDSVGIWPSWEPRGGRRSGGPHLLYFFGSAATQTTLHSRFWDDTVNQTIHAEDKL